MLIIKDLCLVFGQRAIFDNVSLSVNEGQKVGLVGANGSGKSTLLKIIAGLQHYDSGNISVGKETTVAYLPQELTINSPQNIFDEAFSAFDHLIKLRETCATLEHQIQNHESDEKTAELLERYTHASQELAQIPAKSYEQKTESILSGLGFAKNQWNTPVQHLSVGWKMRLVLGKLLLKDADLYLFDEPTNHLDIVTKDWFLDFLQNSKKSFILVSHDRYFLDHACNYIYELSLGKGKMYTANYSGFLEQKQHAEELLEKAYVQQQKEIKKKKETIERFRAKASKASMAQSMIKSLEKIELIEIEKKQGAITFSFAPIARSGDVVLHVSQVSKHFEHKTLFQNVSFDLFRGEKTAVVAANGVGKTTLFNCLMKKTEYKGAVKFGHNVHPAFFEQNQDLTLNPNKTILEEVEESCKTTEARGIARTMLGSFLFPGDDVHKKIAVLSGGEKNRVAMVKVLLTPANFLILDEPTNHLDIQSKEILMQALTQYQGTILFVSHDRSFLDGLAHRILELTPQGIRSFKGNYESFLYCKKQQQAELAATKAPQTNKLGTRSQEQNKQETEASARQKYESRKKLANLERKIAKLEEEQQALQINLGSTEWGSADYKKIEEKIQKNNQELALASAEWEKLMIED